MVAKSSMTMSETETLPESARKYEVLDFSSLRWAWAVRGVARETPVMKYGLLTENLTPLAGDVAVVRVDRVRHHRLIETEWERRIRLYAGDRIVGVFGNRYATDVYEGRILELRRLHLLTASGVIGTVTCRNRDVDRPTAVTFLGYLADAAGNKINTKQICFQPVEAPDCGGPEVVLVVGTGMNTGKTTVTRRLLRALMASGVRVAGCKLTGSASPRDLYEMRATGAVLATDFSDYGFPSTYGESLNNLIHLMDSMTAACSRAGARIAVVEIADGLLQPETRMLLESEEMRRRVKGVVVAGACSGSLLFATEYLGKLGLDVWAASGLITNAPLFVREFSERSTIPVASSRGSGARLGRIIMEKIAAAA